ncbi:hypothetical protein [Planctomicrobium piriforme]|uniref:hypothetical protein n=1 Tax=Planctomicrobium piriforme TaxID=1576369 RepID=UPI0011142EBB|nr:hypothetical protein [Planctomicrobium piriforme]
MIGLQILSSDRKNPDRREKSIDGGVIENRRDKTDRRPKVIVTAEPGLLRIRGPEKMPLANKARPEIRN